MTRPSEEAYQGLLGILREAAAAFGMTEDKKTQLGLARRQLQGVLKFLWSDPEVVAGNLTRPLAVLRVAAYDVGQGATVSLLDHQPTRPDGSVGGKPSGTAREVDQGTLAYGLEMLVTMKVGTKRAADWVATEARRRGITTEDGRPIVGRQIENWRDEINRGKAPALACEVFENCRKIPIPPQLNTKEKTIGELLRKWRSEISPILIKKAHGLVGLLIQSIATVAPESAPKQTRRSKG